MDDGDVDDDDDGDGSSAKRELDEEDLVIFFFFFFSFVEDGVEDGVMVPLWDVDAGADALEPSSGIGDKAVES